MKPVPPRKEVHGDSTTSSTTASGGGQSRSRRQKSVMRDRLAFHLDDRAGGGRCDATRDRPSAAAVA